MSSEGVHFLGTVSVVAGDCLTVMPTLDANSVDAIVSDPPYGLGFMGKAWDHGVPGVEFWTAALRVAKPGAYLAAFGGTRTYHRLTCAIEDAGWEIRDCLSWLYGSGFPKSHNGPWGGTALKPAWEPIILARNPLVGTVAANVQEYGTGALNIDATRIGMASEEHARLTDWHARYGGTKYADGQTYAKGMGDIQPPHPAGRWPANVCLDEDAAEALDAQSGERPSGISVRRNGVRESNLYGAGMGAFPAGSPDVGYNDTGGASRFFYTAKASRAERNAGVEKNAHPTVKPLALMQWLCRLVTPKGGLILDPFCGSGTTGRAAIAEGFRFLGIELSDEYATIARARIAEYAPLFGGAA